MQDIKLPIDLVNGVLSYLASRPYAEVAQLIAAIQAAAQKKEEDAE